MRKFTQMKFFHLHKEFSQPNTDLGLLKDAFEEFVDSVFAESERSCNLSALYNQLCFAQIELLCRQKTNSVNNQEKQSPIQNYYHKALMLIDTQLKLVRLKIKNNNSCQNIPKNQNKMQSNVTWSGSIVEFVELGYATVESKSFNNGDIEIKELIQFFCNVLNFKVKDCYRVLVDIRKRADDRTIYLDKLKKKLIEKLEHLENKKKRRN